MLQLWDYFERKDTDQLKTVWNILYYNWYLDIIHDTCMCNELWSEMLYVKENMPASKTFYQYMYIDR